MKNSILFLFITLLLATFGCTQNAIIQSDFTVKSGSSFGMCLGECYQEVTFNEFQAVLRTAELGRSGMKDIKVKNKRATTPQEWQEIQSLVNEQAISGLADVIGCPDCADGGAEWIEIRSPDLVKKVTFEYRDPPAAIKELVTLLREKRVNLNPTEDN